MTKLFKLSKDKIQNLVHGYGACIATDKITVDGMPVRFMYRDKPIDKFDSGWRFMSGVESAEYMNNPKYHDVYSVNTIANYDPEIIPLLDSPIGAVFERLDGNAKFVAVTDWQPPSA